MKYLGDLWHGISSRPWKLAQYTFAGFSVVLTILRGITYFIPAIKFEGVRSLTIAVGIGSIYGLEKHGNLHESKYPSRIAIPSLKSFLVISSRKTEFAPLQSVNSSIVSSACQYPTKVFMEFSKANSQPPLLQHL